MYEKAFAAYRVYRVTTSGQQLVAETMGLDARDRAPEIGAAYVVVTVRPESGEGARSDPVEPQSR